MSRARPGVVLLLDFAHAIRAFAAAVIYTTLTHSHATLGCLIPTKLPLTSPDVRESESRGFKTLE
jgi:hypothetical protein